MLGKLYPLQIIISCTQCIHLLERAEMSGAVEMAESFLVTSWLSFLAAPDPTVTVLDLRRALEEPSSALEGCSVDMVTVVTVVAVVGTLTRILGYCSSVVLLLCCCGAGTKQVPLSGAWVHGCCGAVVLWCSPSSSSMIALVLRIEC